MKKIVSKHLIMAGAALLLAPAALFAQTDKEKDKSDKKEMQVITITRNSDKDEKTVVEINGDKITVNGKDATADKDVKVNVHKMRSLSGAGNTPAAFSFNFNDGQNLFSTDANRAMLGVTMEASEKGIRVQSVTAKSAAEKAGIQKGDIITKIDSKKIETTDDVTETIRSHKPGDKVAITLSRDGKEQKLPAELSKWEGVNINGVNMSRLQESLNGKAESFNRQMDVYKDAQGLRDVWVTGYSSGSRLGLSIQDVDEGNGVKVLEVDEESNAAKAGIKKDDIITDVDGNAVKGTEDMTKIVRGAGADKAKRSYQLKVLRDGKAQTIEVKIPRKLKTANL